MEGTYIIFENARRIGNNLFVIAKLLIAGSSREGIEQGGGWSTCCCSNWWRAHRVCRLYPSYWWPLCTSQNKKGEWREMPFEWPPRTCCSCRARCPPASVSQQGSCCPWTAPSPPEPRRSIVKRGRYLGFSILQQIHETRLVGNDSQALVEGLDGLHVLVLSHQQQEIVKYETNFSLGSSVIA